MKFNNFPLTGRGRKMSSTSCTGTAQVKFSDQLLALSGCYTTQSLQAMTYWQIRGITCAGTKQAWSQPPLHPRQHIHNDGSCSSAVVKSLIRGYAAFSSSWFWVQSNIFNRLGSFGSAICGKRIIQRSVRKATYCDKVKARYWMIVKWQFMGSKQRWQNV